MFNNKKKQLTTKPVTIKSRKVKLKKQNKVFIFKRKKQKDKKNHVSFMSNNFFVKYKDLTKRILFTLGMLLLIRVGSYITVPGITVSKNVTDLSSSSQFFSLISLLGGGALGKFSVFALGVSPYITASIIVQLLSTDVVPVLTR